MRKVHKCVIWDIPQDRRLATESQRVPAYVRRLDLRGKAVAGIRENAKTLDTRGFEAGLKEPLHPETDSENGLPVGNAVGYRIAQSNIGECSSCRKMSYSRYDDLVGLCHPQWIGGNE